MSVIQVVAIGLLCSGVVIAGYGLYSEYQSSPYLAQIDSVSQSAPSSSTAYEELSAGQKATFQRLLSGQAAQVDGTALEFFSNSMVEYQDRYYEFGIFYDPASFLLLDLAVGAAISALGGGVLLLLTIANRPQVEKVSV